MTNNNSHTLSLEKTYATNAEVIFDLFKNSTIFKLTGADDIQSDFKTDGLFRLDFNERGTIHGQFIQITTNNIILEWNVDGFDRPPEIKTLLEISLRDENNKCVLNLHHKNIMNEEAAEAKKRAWTEILDEIEHLIRNNR